MTRTVGLVLGLALALACGPPSTQVGDAPPPAMQRLGAEDAPEYVRLWRETRPTLARDRWRLPFTVPPRGRLELGVGHARPPRNAAAPGALAVHDLEIGLRVDDVRHVVRRVRFGPAALPLDRWHDVVVPLGGLAGRDVELDLVVVDETGAPVTEHAVRVATPRLLAEHAAPPAGPNVVVVSIDTLRADALGCYGGPPEASPTLDRLAAEGVLFEQAISTSTWTLPAHASMLTGMNPMRHGAIRAIRDGARGVIEADATLVSEVAAEAGIETAAFTGGGFVDAEFGFARGFDRYDTDTKATERFVGTFERAAGWMQARLDRRFFVFLHTYKVHAPYAPPPPYDRLFDPNWTGPFAKSFSGADLPKLQAAGSARLPPIVRHVRALYQGELRTVDDRLGELMGQLTAWGIADRTCIFVTSDHGEEFGEQGRYFHKHPVVVESLLRVPLIAWCPAEFVAGRRVAEPVSIADLMPTALATLGLPVPPGLDGRSLLPVLQGGSEPERRILVSDVDGAAEGGHGYELSLRLGPEKLRYRNTTRGAAPEILLHDLRTDPLEQQDLGRRSPERLAPFTATLDRLTAERDGLTDSLLADPEPAADGTIRPDLARQLRQLGYTVDAADPRPPSAGADEGGPRRPSPGADGAEEGDS